MATADIIAKNNVEHPALDDQDESVRIAVRALGDMRNSVHASPSTSFQPTPALSVSSRSTSPSLDDEESADFVSRVSTTFPLVNTALKAYEQGKASSRVVKYGAEMMESSVKTISRPVIGRLPVNQLDEFACRQLDRIDSYRRRPSVTGETPDRGRLLNNDESERSQNGSWTSALRDLSMVRGRPPRYNTSDSRADRDSRDVSMIRAEDGALQSPGVDDVHSRTPTPRQDETTPAGPSRPSSGNENQQQVAQRSRWQAVLLEAGGIGAAVSEESMRRLKYCLEWLQYATVHIDAQILVLRDFIASLQNAASPSSPRSVANAPLSEHHLQTLTNIRRDVVETIRQVVDVVSKYAGGALPEPAKARVRQFILCLPQRWAQAASGPNVGLVTASSEQAVKKEAGRGRGRTTAPYTYGPGEAGPSSRSRPASRATSPSSLRAHGASRTAANGGPHVATAGSATNAAQKILTLATESLDMLRAVTSVFKDSLDKADAWVERLRYVGVQRQNSSSIASLPLSSSLNDQPEDSPKEYREPLPPIQLTPGSSRAHSPVPGIAALQLPPLDPALYAQSSSYSRHHHHSSNTQHRHHHHASHDHVLERDTDWDNDQGRERYGSVGDGPAKDFDALTLNNGPVVSLARYSSSASLKDVIPEEGEGAVTSGSLRSAASMDVDT
ncbi:transcription factor Opi1-domain-containing protein [Cytidiella melzeri]|nr:transcription factor Opi1-domain-containing protein [Cytidiella melzeri]